MAELPKDTIYHYESDGLNVTITMTELVRCKDCKWIDLCKDPEYYEYKGANGFCSKGERKEDVEDAEVLEAWNLDGSPTRYIKGQKDEQTDYHIENDGTYETGKGDYE